MFSSVSSLHLPVKEALVITHHQNKTVTPEGLAAWLGMEGVGEIGSRRDRRTQGE